MVAIAISYNEYNGQFPCKPKRGDFDDDDGHVCLGIELRAYDHEDCATE